MPSWIMAIKTDDVSSVFILTINYQFLHSTTTIQRGKKQNLNNN
ncbi:hypothetical protein [Aquibacillus halophilus]|nr:hypothetical protein [Aquibacillus halophilus]